MPTEEAPDDFTNTNHFQFKKVAFALSHSDFLALFDKNGRFVQDIDGLVESGVQLRMTSIIEDLFPVFELYFDQRAGGVPCFGYIFLRMRHAVSDAFVVLELGH
ncbi:hypothetical protein LTR17_024736 [Elasticomyces elasticus]|nr:hypothetical protein LTR17_024736 [Elasticomyces elasticus]